MAVLLRWKVENNVMQNICNASNPFKSILAVYVSKKKYLICFSKRRQTSRFLPTEEPKYSSSIMLHTMLH